MRYFLPLFYPLVAIYFLLIIASLAISYSSIPKVKSVQAASVKKVAVVPSVAVKPTIKVVKRVATISATPKISTKTTITPTRIVTPAPTKLVAKVQAATPTPKLASPIVQTAQPTPTSAPKSVATGSVSSFLLAKVNEYRASRGLSDVSSNSQVCDFAAVRAAEIMSDFSHSGFTNRINAKTIPYSYHEITENIAMNSDYTQIVNMWINSPGHAENMRKDTPIVCIMQNGNYFAYEGMRP